jgi:hypothetical protein
MATQLQQIASPAGGGAPLWGLNDQGFSSNEGPLFATDPWDTFWLGTRQLPGVCDVKPGSVARLQIDRKKPKGSDGARLTITGYDPREFQVTCEICTVDQWNELQDIVDVYWTIPGKTRNTAQVAISVYHPNLQWLKIYSAVLAGITPLVPGSIEGAKMTTLTFQENFAPKPKNVTASAGPSSVAEDKRLPPSTAPQNQTPAPPSSNSANLGLSGPPPSTSVGTS